jgi:hypothetical protein
MLTFYATVLSDILGALPRTGDGLRRVALRPSPVEDWNGGSAPFMILGKQGRSKITVGLLLALPLSAWSAEVTAKRFAENPLITVHTSPSLGDNVNGPSIMRVPDWVKNPLGRYYMYFAHHKGQYIRMAYADSLHGPWKIYEPGVMNVADTALFRPQPDPQRTPPGAYTHIASPEIYVDQDHKRIVMWFHGMWTEGKRWPDDPQEARKYLREHGYAQYTQVSESSDGIHFTARPAISRQSYLRVFAHGNEFFAISRLGQLLRSPDLFSSFELGPDPFRDEPYARRVRHVALLPRDGKLEVFLSFIGDAPEGIWHTTISLNGDWTQWKASGNEEVLKPEASYECPGLPVAPSEIGEIYGPARQLRDPALYVENGKIYLFYTICGEQGIAGAEVTFH